jgi:rare lipoprotein A
MTIRRAASFCAVLTAALLVGCAGHPPGGTRATESPGAPSRAADVPGSGIYKVGNPYQIAGVWYRPAEDFGYDETGIASWYGEDFHGKYTANGEIYDLNALTAAHRTLPMPTVVQITNLENGRTMELRVNDRGPFARGRIIDVSRRAAQLLGFEAQGTAKVRVRILVPETIQVVSLARRNGVDPNLKVAEEAPHAAPRDAVVAEALPGNATRLAAVEPSSASPIDVAPAPPAAPAPAVVAVPTVPPPLPETVTVVPVQATHIYIQAGAFARADNALRVKSRLDALGPVRVYGARVGGLDVYRVRLGPIDNVDEADKLLGRVVDSGLAEARIVVD